MTGHEVQLGELFSIQDRKKTAGILWHEIPGKARPESMAQAFRPTKPNIAHYPDVRDFGIRLNDEKHKYGDGRNGRDGNLSNALKTVLRREVIAPLMFPSFYMTQPLSGRTNEMPDSTSGAMSGNDSASHVNSSKNGTILTSPKRRKRGRSMGQEGRFDARRMYPNSNHN